MLAGLLDAASAGDVGLVSRLRVLYSDFPDHRLPAIEEDTSNSNVHAAPSKVSDNHNIKPGSGWGAGLQTKSASSIEDDTSNSSVHAAPSKVCDNDEKLHSFCCPPLPDHVTPGIRWGAGLQTRYASWLIELCEEGSCLLTS